MGFRASTTIPSPSSFLDIFYISRPFFGDFNSPAASFWTYDPSSSKVYSDVTGVVSIDVREEDDKLIVTADLPGMDTKDIKVEVDRNIFRLEITVAESNEQDSDGYIVRERRMGSVRRSIRLPHEVDVDEVTSTYKDGVLEITLPKLEKSQVKQITIN